MQRSSAQGCEPRQPAKMGEVRVVTTQGDFKAQARLESESEASTILPEDDSDRSSGSLEGATRASAEPTAARSEPASGIIIFDWDDTLLPTSFLERVRGQDMDVATRQALRQHALLIEEVLRAARSVAQVSIVTLSRRPWVLQSAERHLPGLDFESLLQELNVTVYYAREHGSAEGAPCAYWVQKRNAIARSLTDWYATGVLGRARLNVLSVGDSIVEKEALKELLGAWHNSGVLAESPFCKTLKLMDQPMMRELGEELREMALWLPSLARHGQGFDISLTWPGQLAGRVAVVCSGA